MPGPGERLARRLCTWTVLVMSIAMGIVTMTGLPSGAGWSSGRAPLPVTRVTGIVSGRMDAARCGC
jgi:hypothetical protein